MIIFSPGPANISERVRRALLRPDICHRSIEFSRLLNNVRRLICLVCGEKTGYEPVVFTGSGTAAIEASIASLNGLCKRLLIISNGIYGERAYEISKIHKIDVKKIKFPDNKKPNLTKIERSIKRYKPDAVYVVHHETTTGLLNPLKEIAHLANRYKATVLVDGISSIGSEELKLKKWYIDLIIGSANKCIRGVSGLSFVFLSNSYAKRLRNRKRGSYYLDLHYHLIRERGGQTPFTPAVQNFYAFEEVLRELLDEGLNKRIKHYKRISSILREGLRKRGFKIYVEESLASNTMTTVLLPSGISYKWLHKECKKQGYEIYGALGKLRNKAFRLGIVGCITQSDIHGFLKTLDKIMM